MTFGEFKAAVMENLGPDAQRTGAGTSGLDAFKLRSVINAMIDMQRYIEPLRTHTDASILHNTLTLTGRASQGTLSAGAKPKEFWLVAVADATKRYPLDAFPWSKRYDLINGDVADEFYAYSLSPDGRTYLIHPGLTTATKLNLVWQGIKTSWIDADVLADAWDNAVAEAVGEYVKFRIVRTYDKDSVARAERHREEYRMKRLAIVRDTQEVGG